MPNGYEVLLKAYLSWGDMASQALSDAMAVDIPEEYAACGKIVVLGMGGSGVAGDYLRAISDEYGGRPIHVVKGYRLPSWVDDDTLVMAISYSGETKETIMATREAIARSARVVVIAGGGRLEELAKQHKVPLIRVVRGPAARATFPYLFYACLAVARRLRMLGVPEEALTESVALLRHTEEALKVASSVAAAMAGRRLLVAASQPYDPLAVRTKNELNENSKEAVLTWLLPESGHNDVEAQLDSSWAALLYTTGEEDVDALVDAAREVLESQGVGIVEVKLEGASLLPKLSWGTLVAGLLSLELARMKGVDPLETPRIKLFRSKVSEVLK